MPPPPPGRGRWTLATCCLSVFIVNVDSSALNVALPTLRDGFHCGLSALQWTVDAYTLVLATFLMLFGSVADRVGRRRVFRTGLAVFTAASVLCSLAPGIGWLVAGRAVQAVGGAMLNPVAMSIIATTFPEPRARARALGVWSAVLGASLCAGPVVGGLAVELAGWRAIFWLNVPVGLAALALTVPFVPESRAARARRPDPVGQALVMALLASLTFAIIDGRTLGWTAPPVLAALALCPLALAGLVRYEPRVKDPLIDVALFRSAPFSGAVVTAVAAFAALNGFLFLNTLYLQGPRGFGPLAAGAATVPLAAATLLTAPLSGRLTGTRGPTVPLVCAGVALAAGGVLRAVAVGPATALAVVCCVYVAFGAGVGFVNTPISDIAVAGMPPGQAGVAAAVASTSRHVGACLGVAVTGALNGGDGGGDGPWWFVTGCGLTVVAAAAAAAGRPGSSGDRVRGSRPGAAAPGRVGCGQRPPQV